MHVLVVGATGFIASQIVLDLIATGHTVTACVRNTNYAKTIFPGIDVIACDFTKDTIDTIWIERLKKIAAVDVVINCVGIFYHPLQIWSVHYETPKALFNACVNLQIKKIIHISALGIDRVDVAYAKSKKAADEYLQSLPIPSVILRPSLVMGRGSYGGSSLFRGLCGLPFLLALPGKGQQMFQPIYLAELSQAILKLLNLPLEKSLLLHAVGPEQINLRNILLRLRAWLGFSKPKIILPIPLFFIRLGAFIGNIFPNSTMNATAYKMLMRNNITTKEETNKFINTIGFTPKNFEQALQTEASTVQDHWHARLFFLKPLLQYSLAFLWLFSGFTSLFIYPQAFSFLWLAQVGVPEYLYSFFLYSASTLDILIGLALLFNFQLKKIGILQIAVIIVYSVIISFKLPELWLLPIGPITKNIPLLVACGIFLALESDR